MTTHLDQPKNDKSRLAGFGAMVWALGSPLRGTGTADRAPPPPVLVAGVHWFAWPMIKPSTHQRVAIDVHRQDWP